MNLIESANTVFLLNHFSSTKRTPNQYDKLSNT